MRSLTLTFIAFANWRKVESRGSCFPLSMRAMVTYETPAQLRTCIRSKGIRDRTLCPIAALDGVDDGHIIRITYSLVSMVLYNGQFVGTERSTAVNVPKPTVEKGKIGCKPSALQVSYSFCHGHEAFAASPAHHDYRDSLPHSAWAVFVFALSESL